MKISCGSTKIRIKSEGTSATTRIFLIKDGSEIPLDNVKEIKWEISAGSIATCHITFSNVEIDVIGHEKIERTAAVDWMADGASVPH